MEEVIYFEINNWFCGEDYPKDKIFIDWVANLQFNNDNWCRENKLCVLAGFIDMSCNWCITAPRSWVEKNCPKLLTDEEYTYSISILSRDTKETIEHTKKYSDFICKPDEDGEIRGKISNWLFKEYCEDNIGVTFVDEEEDYYDDEEEDYYDDEED